MKVFKFNPSGSVYILDSDDIDFIRTTLDADEVTELVRDYHRNQIERVGRWQWLRQWFGLLGLMFYQ
jgi:hypothetical protein